MQIVSLGDNLHDVYEKENSIWHFMMCQILFSRKNKKNISNLLSAEFAHSMVGVKD